MHTYETHPFTAELVGGSEAYTLDNEFVFVTEVGDDGRTINIDQSSNTNNNMPPFMSFGAGNGY